MGGASGHVEGRRDENDPGTPQAHAAGEFLKAQVKADTKPQDAKLRLKGGNLIAGGEGVRLPEALPAGNVDIKEMDLAVLGDLTALADVYKRQG